MDELSHVQEMFDCYDSPKITEANMDEEEVDEEQAAFAVGQSEKPDTHSLADL